MVVRVKLRGLNKRRSRGKWYVSLRETGETLIRGLEGDEHALQRRLDSDEFLRLYHSAKNRKKKRIYDDGTLGNLVDWFKTEYPRWDKLSEHSQKDYQASFDHLEPEFDYFIADLTPPDIYALRNRASKAKWPRFADKLVSNLSAMFSEAVKVGMMPTNPCRGVEKLHKADKNANHEWTPEEVEAALAAAPAHLLTPLVLARYQGFRGQTCASIAWKEYVNDAQFGKAFSAVIRKNWEPVWFPAAPETIAHLAAVKESSAGKKVKSLHNICTTSRGHPWKTERILEKAVSDYLKTLKKAEKIRKGCTLHGLRVTFAASIKRRGYGDEAVSDALGDRSRAMGRHYTRHVERQATLTDIFTRKNVVQKP
jgi:integrase